MFTLKSPREKTGLDEVIEQLIDDMKLTPRDSDDYVTMVKQLDTLYKLKAIDKPERVSRDTVAIIVGNLVGIVLIISYEQKNIVTSKALGFLRQVR